MNERNPAPVDDDEIDDDGYRTEYPVIEGYAPGHYKSWKDIPDVERDE
jgi:hypothetical protein